MAWTAEQMAQKRAKLQKKTNAAAGGAEPLSQRKSADSRNPLALGSTGNSVSDNSNPWTAEKMAEKRAALQTQKQQTGTDLYSTALEDYRTRNNLGFADAMDNRSDELNRQKVTVSPAGKGTWYGQQAQKLKNSYAEYSQPDAFDQANQWFDQPRNQELVNKLLEKKSNYTSYAETGTSRNGASAGDGSIDPFRTTGIKGKVGNTYSTADLKKLGYTDTEIRQAREYLDTMEEIPEWKQLARRTANTVGGVADTVAAAPLMGAEYLVQAGKNIRQSSENRKALEAELARNPREKNLYDQLMETDMDYQPKYSTGDLLQQGFTRQEIEDMRSRIAGTEAKGGIDTEKSVGYQLYNRGQQLTGAAQSGLTDVQRTVQGVATSAAENLAVAAINPAAVLPVLSAQGAADAMGKSAAKDESAGKALVGGVAKFGAGWAINSVGAADLARTMGADYARNSVAGAVADKIRALAGDSAFAAAHPAVANAISGGIDNAVQAFVETYADKAIDAALGDSEAAQTMFTTDTLVQALEAGLTGGASGALGGAVGTGLSRMNAGDSSLRGNVERYAAQDEYEQALKEHQRREELAREPEPLSQRVGADSPPNSGALGISVESDGTEKGSADLKAAGPAAEGNSAETAAISDNLAVQTFAEAAAGDSLTGKTIRLFNPEAGNEANRAAFEEAYGVKLPSTAAATWRMLREVAAQRSQQNAVENAGESVESSTETAADGAEPLSQRISADSPPSMGAIGRTGNVELTAQNGADRQAVMQSVPVEESTLDGMDSSNSPMRETYGMEAPKTEGQKQARTEQVLRSWKVGEKAAQEISLKQPEGVDSDRYAAAASTLYRLGQMEDVKTFDQALELAGTGSGMAANVNYVLGNLKGRNALKIAYTYGRDAAETRWAKSQLGGNLTEQSLTGRGETIYKGTLRNANDAGSQVIELNAAATGTTAVLKNVLQNGAGQADSRVRAYVDTETARIFFGDSAQDTFGTVLHEDYHWYNALDSEGAKTLQDHALLYLARSSGFETVDEMIREKMTDYAQQNLTYEEAAEELVGDAWRGIFSNESDFKRWVEFQRGQAEKNSGRAGTIRTVMNRVKEMLGGIVSRAKEVLTLDPDNRAALKAQRLAENERRILQDEYFAHAEKAMDNLRSAKENAAALKTESAAEGRGVRYSINPSYAQDIDEWNRDGRNSREIFVLGSTAEALQGLGARENDIYMKGDKISLILEQHPEMTLNEIKRIPEILDDPILVLSSRNKGRAGSQNTRLVLFGSVKAQDGRPVLCVLDLQPVENRIVIQDMQKATSAYTKDNDPVRFVRNSEVLYTSENKKRTTALLRTLGFQMPSELQRYGSMGSISYHGQNVKMEGVPFTKIEPSGGTHMESEDSRSRLPKGSIYQESADTVLKTEEGGERPSFPAKNSIAQENAESKGNSEPVKKSVRFQLSDGSAGNVDELAILQKESRELEHQQNALKTERTNWLNSAEVKEIEGKRKSLGLFSAEAKEFKASEEYQAYLAKRKDFNQRGAELENRIGEVNNALREAHAKLETQRNEQKQKQQAVYDAKAKEAGGAAKYRCQLAVEQFGTTSEFERAGYILPDGQMLDFARNDKTRDTDHREIMSVFGPAEVSEGTDALNKFLADGNVRVMAEAPGVDLAADKAPTAAQLEQIREMVGSLGSEQRKFTLDISTTDGRVAASKEYSGRIDADRVVREIRDYYKTGELPAESSLARFRYQLAAKAEQAERDARKNTQRQASRAIADNSAAMETLAQMMGVTHGVRISQDSIDGLAVRWTKANGSRADRTKIAGETRALVEYMTADGASMSKASALSETIADEILSGATYRNTELWDEYPEYHDLSYTVNKDGPAKAELVKRYGTWSEAVAEARKHGVKLRQAEGVRDGNPAEVYESIVNDTRAMGGTKEGAAALFRGAAQEAGVDGAASMESTEWLDVLMNVHDAIKPRMMSRFADAAEYEDAKVELADRMLGDILNVPEMTDAQAIFDGFQRWQRQAVAAAVGEENAEQALKDLRKVQKEQNREFNRRMYENSRNGSRDEALRQWTEQQKRNEKAEKLLDQNLDTLGLDITNYGDMAEKLDVLKEAYEREWKAEKKRLKEERQQMLDEIRLENKQLKRENWNLSHQVAGEQRRADRAEWQLIHQENELLEWEQENQRKAQEWQEKQAERNAIAITAAQQQRDEDIAIAKKLAEKRVQKARDGRQKDELRRGIRANAAQLNQMILRPSKDRYVQPHLIQQAAEVAKLADMTLLNDHAVARLTALRTSIMQSMGAENSSNGISEDWKLSKVPELIDALQADLNASKQAQLDRLNQQLTEAEALPDSEKAEMLRDRLRKRIRETENRTYLPMTVDQMRMLKAITTSTLHVIRTANKTLSLQKAEAVDKIANEAAAEVRQSKGNDGKLRSALTRYNLDMLGAGRVFRMLGGYAKNSQMEKLGTMLNDGQREQTRIIVEGTKLFDNVTGKKNLKQMEQFAGKGAKLVDLGLKDNRGKAAPLTHAQMCSLYMHLRNADSKEHLMNGGFTVPDAVEYNKGNIAEAYQKGQTVRIGMLTDSEGKPMADTIVSAIEKNLTDYDLAWIGSMEKFFGSYTTDLINETSMKLLGYKRAVVKNYYPIAVNQTALVKQIEGEHCDATIEGRGFLKNRVKSPQPILLEECNNVVQRSLRDTAAYAGLAPAIRDVKKVLNSRIETEDGLKVLKDGILEEKWGSDAVDYVEELLVDLQSPGKKTRKSSMTALGKLRGNYAGAILTLNPGVAIAQAASLPTAGAVLGADTMAAVVPFVKNFSPKQRAALEAEIAEHGDALLQYRQRGSQRGELESIGKNLSAAEKGMEKVPKQLTGWINGVDEITVAALWEGSKRYVEHHTNEFAEGAATKGSEAYWEAVNKTYQRVIEETQPNYTTMQRAGIQRSDNELVRTLTMFTTQRFQNYGILADAVMDYNAQRERSHADPTEENRVELKRAGKNLNRAVTSQLIQTAVFAAMKIGADFLLHRWDREQDENGDITALSALKRYADLYVGSAAGTFLYGSELYSFVGNVAGGKDYDVVSAPNLSAVNDLGTEAMRLYKLLATDTGEMDEEELEAYHEKLRKAAMTFMEDGLELKGLPAGNAAKLLEAAWKWGGNAAYAVTGGKYGEKLSLNSLPASATGQYDRLYNAIRSGDTEEAAAALGKLEAMGKDEKTIASKLKNRLKKYSPEVEQAARARNEGDDRKRQELTRKIVRELYDGLGVSETAKSDQARRDAIIDLVTGDKRGGNSYGVINELADELLAGNTEGSVYDDLTEAVDTGRTSDVQDEIRRLRTAGKEDGSIKTKITAAVKEEYLAGNDHDREKLEKLLTSLTKEDGTAMYEEKNFAQWVKDAAKKEEQAKNSKDEWAGVR
ncbi:MuF-C-terminal domain-containing protein [Faecalibacterium duncaniae]